MDMSPLDTVTALEGALAEYAPITELPNILRSMVKKIGELERKVSELEDAIEVLERGK